MRLVENIHLEYQNYHMKTSLVLKGDNYVD